MLSLIYDAGNAGESNYGILKLILPIGFRVAM